MKGLVGWLFFCLCCAQTIIAQDILHYHIQLNIIHLSNKKIDGFTDVRFRSLADDFNLLGLSLLSLQVDSVWYRKAGGSWQPALFRRPDTTAVQINFPALQSGDTAEVRIFYQGRPVQSPGFGGFYFTDDSLHAYNLGVNIGGNEPGFGKAWFPCKDNFSDRATYSFHMRVKDGNTAVCNGTLVRKTDLPDATTVFEWRLRDPIPTYLASVAVSNYVAVEDTFMGMTGTVPIAIYVNPSDVTAARAHFATLKPTLRVFESHFGPYRWERVGYVSVPFTGGAMEHATSIAYPRIAIQVGAADLQWLMAHELSHSWFGNLVTCESANEMWLNEGWATFCEGFYTEKIRGIQQGRDYVRTKHEQTIRKAHQDDSGYFAVANVPAKVAYGSTVYNKGAGVVHSLRGYLGDSLFFNGIKAYLDYYKYRTVNSDSLQRFLSQYTGRDLRPFFGGWVFTPGYADFSVDTLSIRPVGTGFEVTLLITQALNQKPAYIDSNRIEIELSNRDSSVRKQVIFSGANTTVTFMLGFRPENIHLDPDDRYCEGHTTNAVVEPNNRNINFPTEHFTLISAQARDSTPVRVSHHWVSPDTNPVFLPPGRFQLATNRYWQIHSLPQNTVSRGTFRFDGNARPNRTSATGYLDKPLTANTWIAAEDSVYIFYRPNSNSVWQPVMNLTRSLGSSRTDFIGSVTVDSLKVGQYALGQALISTAAGAFDWLPAAANHPIIYPNPLHKSDNKLYIICPEAGSIQKQIVITDQLGRTVEIKHLTTNDNNVVIDLDVVPLAKGLYFLTVFTDIKPYTFKLIIN